MPGHEIAGTIEQIGPEVTRQRVGDRVGIGVMVDSCRECVNCMAGEEQYCLKGKIDTYNAIGKDGQPTYGGYSTHIVADEDFVLRIPDGVGLDVAAPLLCAGITLYSPLKHWGAGVGRQVAIVGLGGLGHIGVKIAAALGAEVTVLSQTPSKQEDGKRLGANHFYTTSDEATFKKLENRFDLIVSTVSAVLPMDDYMGLLRVNGTFVNLGLPADPLPVKAFSLINNRRSLSGSMVGGVHQTQEMLDFCAAHGLGADIEVIGGADIDRAFERVVASDVRYRFVIDTATF